VADVYLPFANISLPESGVQRIVKPFCRAAPAATLRKVLEGK
jgi:hypothetical protein